MTTENTLRDPRRDCRRPQRSRLLACAITFAATLVASPGHAVNFPNLPLQSGSAYPAANVRFILDDSGSMNFIAMPADVKDTADTTRYGNGVQNGLSTNVTDMSYVNNSIYYNPATNYQPWFTVDNSGNDSRFTGGTSYDAAYWHPNLLTTPVDLGSWTQTFFVPKASAAANSTANADYYRYQILTMSGSLRVVRSEWGRRRDAEGEDAAGCANATNTNGSDWRNCTFSTPTGRSDKAEMQNFATWYSYHRTRMKVAKAGASEAFAQLKDDLRIGFDSINQNENGYTIPYDIPVGTDDGRFRGNNRRDWFRVLQAATGSSSTPLHTALQRAGKYFASDATDGPWGPETKQITCRQSFAILTTDGFWNSTTGYAKVGDADGTSGPTITSSSNKSWTYNPASPYKDNYVEVAGQATRPDTLADVAMYYWKNDLRTTLENNVPDSFDDPAFWQHMVTFGVSIGLQGRLNPKTDLPSITNGTKHWGDPINAEDADRIDDLWHASVNGRGDFLVASNTKEFVQGLLEAFATVAQRLGSASNVTANSTSFASDTRVYQASYVSGKWAGELAAYDATAAGVATTPAWKASGLIPTSNRKVLTWNGTSGDDFPTTSQASLLDQSTRPLSPVSGADNADYIKGTRTRERQNGGELRNRDTLLGDIVDSSPMYVKDTETIYAGANDGMLHAFNALNGAELFAYVPAGLDFAQLKTLSDPQYSHRHFVDGPVLVSTRRQTPGSNYLVGSLGRGGKGLFGLDVTTPGNFRSANVLWELTTGNNLGNVLGEPLVVTLNDSNRKAIVFGNGYNSTSGLAVLYVVDIATGAVIQEISTGIGSDNGLGAPRGWDEDGNGTVDYLYAGDLKGNLWKFDFTSGTGSVALAGQPLFTTGPTQPITAGLALARDPTTGKRWVFFGTGSFMTNADLTDANLQAIYGVIDSGATVALGSLQNRRIAAMATVNGRMQRAFEASAALSADKQGWYLNLDNPAAGERIVSRPQVRGKVLIFSSLIPPTDNTCEAGGKGFVNALDVFTGTGLSQPYFDSNGDGKVDNDDITGSETLPTGSIDLGVGMPTLPTIIDNLLVVGGSKGNIGKMPVNPQGVGARRISWHEILGD
ncbi:pilus assembly protein [Lysobacter fragariae]